MITITRCESWWRHIAGIHPFQQHQYQIQKSHRPLDNHETPANKGIGLVTVVALPYQLPHFHLAISHLYWLDKIIAALRKLILKNKGSAATFSANWVPGWMVPGGLITFIGYTDTENESTLVLNSLLA